MASSRWLWRPTPTMGAVTTGFFATQARATWARETCRSRATSATRSTMTRSARFVVQALTEGVGFGPVGLHVPVPGQLPARQRAPRQDADGLIGTQRVHLALLLAIDEVVVVLHRDETGPTVLALQVERLAELPCVHGGGAEVADLAALHQIVQRLQGLLDRGGRIPAMDLVEVDVVHAQSAQTGVHLGEDRLPGQAGEVGAVAHPTVHLGRHHQLVAPTVVGQGPADDLLAGSGRVDVRGVEEVDPCLDRRADQRP